MEIQKCKGTRDLLPEDMRRFRFIEKTFTGNCIDRGYEEVRTSTIEYLHLFTSTGTLTPSRLRGVYSFLDWDGWSGERVVLRPDGTIPIARLFIDSMSGRKTAKLFYVTNVFSFEGTGKETRERWQCGAELIGNGSTKAELEIVSLAFDVLAGLGLKDVKLKLSHAGLIRQLLTGFKLDHEEQDKVFDRLLDGDLTALSQLNPGMPGLLHTLQTLLTTKGSSAGYLKNMSSLFNHDLPALDASFKDFIQVVGQLDSIKCPYEIDITSGRGFEYYTGLIFRIFAGDKEVGGGGRYDALIPLMGGPDAPALGFALYLDCLMDMVGLENPSKKPARGISSKGRKR